MQVDGRAGMTLLDPAVQNWESGVELTVSGCTFFRNFCSKSDSTMRSCRAIQPQTLPLYRLLGGHFVGLEFVASCRND